MHNKLNNDAKPFISLLLRYQFIKDLMQLSFIDSIYLYGSRARGDNSPTSDIDLAIACPEASQDDWRKVMDIIEEESDTLLKIDCVRLDQADEQLKKNIFEQGKLIYGKH